MASLKWNRTTQMKQEHTTTQMNSQRLQFWSDKRKNSFIRIINNNRHSSALMWQSVPALPAERVMHLGFALSIKIMLICSNLPTDAWPAGRHETRAQSRERKTTWASNDAQLCAQTASVQGQYQRHALKLSYECYQTWIDAFNRLFDVRWVVVQLQSSLTGQHWSQCPEFLKSWSFTVHLKIQVLFKGLSQDCQEDLNAGFEKKKPQWLKRSSWPDTKKPNSTVNGSSARVQITIPNDKIHNK